MAKMTSVRGEKMSVDAMPRMTGYVKTTEDRRGLRMALNESVDTACKSPARALTPEPLWSRGFGHSGAVKKSL